MNDLLRTQRKRFIIAGSMLVALIAVCFIGGMITTNLFPPQSEPASLAGYNPQFHAEIRQFNLADDIRNADSIIAAIHQFRAAHKNNPATLQDLVPHYLSAIPRLSGAELIEYEYTPAVGSELPFIFFLYGRYRGLQAMHGWKVRYCPVTYPECQGHGRVNEQWMWVVSSW